MLRKGDAARLAAFHRDRARLTELGLAYGACLRAAGKKVEKRALEASRLRSRLDDLLGRMSPPPAPSAVPLFMTPPGNWPPPPDPGEMIPGFDPSRIIPPRGRGALVVQSCLDSQDITAKVATYLEFSRSGVTVCSAHPPKSVSLRVSAGQSTQGHPLLSAATCGYRSIVDIEAAHPGSVTVSSAMNASIGWIEANTCPAYDLETGEVAGGGGSASAVVRCGMSVLVAGAITAPPETTLASHEARGDDQVSYAVNFARSAQLEARISLPSAGTYSIVVDEWISMTAAAENAHAYISGSATWDPVQIRVRCGCRSVRLETFPGSFGDYAR